ncbi:MAG: DUF349 domain-containing protein [Cyclobacteriaceae bacterium]
MEEKDENFTDLGSKSVENQESVQETPELTSEKEDVTSEQVEEVASDQTEVVEESKEVVEDKVEISQENGSAVTQGAVQEIPELPREQGTVISQQAEEVISDQREVIEESKEASEDKPELSPENNAAEIHESARDKSELSNDNEEVPSEQAEQIASDQEGVAEDNKEVVEGKAEVSQEKDSAEAGSESSTDETSETDKQREALENLDLTGADKEGVYSALKEFSSTDDMRLLDQALKDIKPHFDKLYNTEKEKAKEEYLSQEGADAADFQFKGDEVDANFFLLYNTLRDKKQKFFSQLTKDKDANLKRKNELLDSIRILVDGEETNASMNEMKALQSEWKTIGQVPGQHAKTLWANYNALLDRFYDNRSIYFELKELDRKKNLEAKLALCVKVEALDSLENIKSAINQLNDFHEEFKHIGPVPKEEQDALWDRFKAASDKIYSKRKEFYEELKSKLSENVAVKLALGDEVATFANFDSDKISDWNKKTKQLQELQKKWESSGGLPKEQAKEVNKHFWSNFKKFFANKNNFFKKLESERQGNLELKLELLKKAEVFKESTEWDKTAGELKKLQQQWREIGPVPEKHRNDVYQKFKAACDTFFERKRSDSSGQGAEYLENLTKKESICSMLEAYLNSDDIALDEVFGLLDQYSEVGFVPKESIDAIHKRFDAVIERLLGFEELTSSQRSEIEIKVQVNKLKNSPHGAQKLNRKEGAIKRKIGELENEISTYKTNMDFFAASKNADKLKEELLEKIGKAEIEIQELRRQLKVFRKM